MEIIKKKPTVDMREFMSELRELFDKYDNVKATAVYEDVYNEKSDFKLLFMIFSNGNRINGGGLLQDNK